MRHSEITSKITGSSSGDWALLLHGPFFLTSFGEVISSEQHWLETDSHDYLAVHKADVDLRLAWGLTVERDLEPEGWVFADRQITRLLVDAFWQGSLVARWTVLSVDGHRCYLPDAERAVVETGTSIRDYETVAWTSRASQVALARLLQKLVRGTDSEFDSYFQRAGIVEFPDG